MAEFFALRWLLVFSSGCFIRICEISEAEDSEMEAPGDGWIQEEKGKTSKKGKTWGEF